MKLVSILRRAGLALAATLVLAGPAMAQAYDGDWAGALSAGGAEAAPGAACEDRGGATSTATLDSLDQNATLEATAVKTEGGELSILFLSAGGELVAKLAPDGQSLVGEWKQGATLPLTLTKQPPGAK